MEEEKEQLFVMRATITLIVMPMSRVRYLDGSIHELYQCTYCRNHSGCIEEVQSLQ
jgi:hypothetical protein